MAIATFPYSAFLRGPSDVLPGLQDADVVLERRDAENLVLSTYARFAARAQGTALAARILTDILRDDPSAITGALESENPWMRWLPPTDKGHCIDELLGELAAGADTGVLEPFARALTAWRHTAEIWSNPDLSRQLQGPFASIASEIQRPKAPC